MKKKKPTDIGSLYGLEDQVKGNKQESIIMHILRFGCWFTF